MRFVAVAGAILVAGVLAVVAFAAGSDGDSPPVEPDPPSLAQPGARGEPAPPTLVVFFDPSVSDVETERVGVELAAIPELLDPPVFCDGRCSLAEAQVLLASDPQLLAVMDESTVPISWQAEPADGVTLEDLSLVADSFREFPAVRDAVVRHTALPVESSD